MRNTLVFPWIFALLLLWSAALHAQPQGANPETLVKPVLAQIRAGKETPEQAWQAGELNADLVLAALGSWELVDAGIALPKGDMKLARGLVQTLLVHQPKLLEQPANLPSRALLHLANVLGGQGDARAVALYEEVLSRQTKRNPIWPDEVDASLYNLASYYERKGDVDKAIATKTRIYQYTTFPSLLANFELQIARLYSRKGDENQAAQWYEVAEARKTPRTMGVARMDRAESLFRQGKTAEARELLLELAQKPEKQPIQIALWTRLAQSYFAEGDLETARKTIKNAVDQLHGLPEKSDDPYVVAYGPQAEQLAAQIETRLNSPFFWRESQTFVFAQPRQEAGVQRLVLQFKTAPKAAIEFRCDNPAVRLEPAVADVRQPLQRVVFLSFEAAKFDFAKAKTSTMTEIVARSPEFPEQEARLPVQIYVPQRAPQEATN